MDGWVWRSLCQLLQRGRAPARRPDGPSAPFPWCSGSPPSWPRQHAVPKSFLCAGPCADQGWWQRQAGNQAWRAGRPLPETSTPEGRVGLVLTAFPAPQKDSAHSRCSASVRPLSAWTRRRACPPCALPSSRGWGSFSRDGVQWGPCTLSVPGPQLFLF